MIRDKKGLSDIVTTVLIILLVAVAVAAVWAFVSPSLKGTGTQFTKTQTCISNVVEPIECKGTVSGTSLNYPVDVRVRRSLSDSVAVLTSYKVSIGAVNSVDYTSTTGGYLNAQGDTVVLSSTTNMSISPGLSGPVGSTTSVLVTAKYTMPDQTVIECKSLPTTCSK